MRNFFFKHCNWLECFISLNIYKRNETTIVFEKGFSNFLKSAIYGKTMENVRNRLYFKFIKKVYKEKSLKLIETDLQWKSKISYIS